MDNLPLIVYDEEDVREGVNSCLKSLVGCFLTEKPIHANSLPNALAGIWCNPKGFKVENVGDKTYQFLFAEEKDVNRILQGSPWIFRNSWLSLKRWERGQSMINLNFHIIPLKIQIWGLPLHCRTSKMGRKIGAAMGEVMESDLFEIRERGSFVKVTILFDSSKPLKHGIHVGSKTDGITLVDFQYERLPQFCSSCCLIGHDEDASNEADPHPKKPTADVEGDKERETGISLGSDAIIPHSPNRDTTGDSPIAAGNSIPTKKDKSLGKENIPPDREPVSPLGQPLARWMEWREK
ncbi:Zinc knuckle CX2CX4HX4C [Sesbania bispinosa]|nr:Zinc knuckle CX2CX4HX4C [Sesbania bispinosa]